MKTLKLTELGDIDLTGNTLNIIENTDEIDQYIRTLLNIRKGEWFLDTNLGLNHENLFAKIPNEELTRLDVIEALRQELRVDEIGDISIDFNRVDRLIIIDYTITTINGDIVNGEVVLT